MIDTMPESQRKEMFDNLTYKLRFGELSRERQIALYKLLSEREYSQLEKRYIWLRDQATLHNRLNTVIRLLGLDGFFHEWEFDQAIDKGMERLGNEDSL
jgi:hypothetical protein